MPTRYPPHDDDWSFGKASDCVLASVGVILDRTVSREAAVERLLPTLKKRYGIKALTPQQIIEKPVGDFPDVKSSGVRLRFTADRVWVIEEPGEVTP